MCYKRFFTTILLLILALSVSVIAENAKEREKGQNVPLHPIPSSGSYPRSPAHVPIECYYLDGSLTFYYSVNLGTIQCVVFRQQDAQVFSDTFYACTDSTDSLYVSDEAGDYAIMLTCADSTEYSGDYTLNDETICIPSLPEGYKAYFGGSVMVTGVVNTPALVVPTHLEDVADVSDLGSEKGYQGVMDLKPVEYTFEQKEDNKPAEAGSPYGLIAEEVQEVYPELVRKEADGILSVDYTALVPLLIQTVQQLDAEVKTLRETIENIKANSPGFNTAGLGNNYFGDPEVYVSKDRSFEIAYTLPETVKSARLYIYSISGKLVSSYLLEGRGKGSFAIDTSKLAKGTYIYTLIADDLSIGSSQMIVQ